jgi:hypothetical protein
MANDRIGIIWEGESELEAKESIARMQRDDPGAQLKLHGDEGIIPLPIIIGGIIGILALSREIQRIVCLHNHPGLRFDATRKHPKLMPAPELPNGTVFIIPKEGEAKQLDVCGGVPAEAIAEALKVAAGALGAAPSGNGADKKSGDKATSGSESTKPVAR